MLCFNLRIEILIIGSSYRSYHGSLPGRSFNLRIEILIIGREDAGRDPAPPRHGFNLRIEILIIGRASVESPLPVMEIRCFNLRIEILIIGSRNEVYDSLGWTRLVSISELRFLSLVEPIISDQCW